VTVSTKPFAPGRSPHQTHLVPGKIYVGHVGHQSDVTAPAITKSGKLSTGYNLCWCAGGRDSDMSGRDHARDK